MGLSISPSQAAKAIKQAKKINDATDNISIEASIPKKNQLTLTDQQHQTTQIASPCR